MAPKSPLILWKRLLNRKRIDLSRCLNFHIDKAKVKLDSLATCQNMLERFDFMTVFDLQNCYFHIQLADSLKKFFNFSLPSEDRTIEFFSFLVMAYGYAPAGRIITRLIKPLIAFCHSLGIRLSIYLDDGRVLASSS